MKSWTLDDIPWSRFERDKVDREHLPILKAASVIEYNAIGPLAQRLRGLFHDDPAVLDVADRWARDEARHGEALARWTVLADPGFDHAAACAAADAVRGARERDDAGPTDLVGNSRPAELVIRCLAETGTSSYYAAMAEASTEPVLRTICRHIAADEIRHYKLFHAQLTRYLRAERMSLWDRLRVAARRMAEPGDDELAYAYHVANPDGRPYEHRRATSASALGVYSVLRRHHIERSATLILRAAGLEAQGWLRPIAAYLAWWALRRRVQRLRRLVA